MSKLVDASSETLKTLWTSRVIQGCGESWEELSPLSHGEFEIVMDRLGPFPVGGVLALALSGGADSLSLLLLLKNWVADRDLKLVALHVHHGLRPESCDESRWVAKLCRGLEVPCAVLSWQDRPQKVGQREARKGRYDLLGGYLLSQGITYLVTAHHADDQLETHLMRLDHGSGDWGCAGMSARRAMPWGWMLRPLLSFEKARLYKTLLLYEQPWIEDPGNQSSRYKRTHYRQQLSTLSRQQNQALRERVRLLGEERAVYEEALRESLRLALEVKPWGEASFNPQLFKAYWGCRFRAIKGEEEAVARALCLVLHALGGGEYPPGMQQVRLLVAGLERGRAEGAKSRLACRTLARCQITMTTRGDLCIIRERRGLKDCKTNKSLRVAAPSLSGVALCKEPHPRQLPEVVAPSLSGVALWDGRFVIREILCHNERDGVEVGACGLVPDCTVEAMFDLLRKMPLFQASWLLPKLTEKSCAQRLADSAVFVSQRLWATLPIIFKGGAAFGWPAWDGKGCRLVFLCCNRGEIVAEGDFFAKKNLYQAVFSVV